MKLPARILEVLTRPAVVLAMRAAWDVGYGVLLIVGLQLAVRTAPEVGAATVAVGAYTAYSARRARRLGVPRKAP